MNDLHDPNWEDSQYQLSGLRQAELAEAETRARAAEELEQRWPTLALAATVLLALTLVGGWLWIKADRDARQAQVTRDVNDALNQAMALREQAKATVTDKAALFVQAWEQPQQALVLVKNGPGGVVPKAHARHLQADLDEKEKDRALVAALDEARLAQAETVAGENRFAMERAVPLFRAAFRVYGLPVGEGKPEDAAERIRQRPAEVREAILAALDEWEDLAASPALKIREPHREWLRAVLAAAEPENSWGRQVRAARAEKDPAKRRAALAELATSADAAKLPARALTRLAWNLDPAQQVALLRRAQLHYPSDFWINHNLGIALQQLTSPEREEAVRFLTAAVALRPSSPGCLLNLGSALYSKGSVDEAIAWFRKAIALEPKYAVAHNSLGNALAAKGRVDEAIACFKMAIMLDPSNTAVHHNLGVSLYAKGQVEEAIVCYKKAIALDPKNAAAHYNLGNALRTKGQVEEAIACFKKAIALEPNYAEAHCNLGDALANQGRFAESLEAYRRGHELGSQRRGWPYPSADWVRLAEQRAALESQIPAFLKGEFQPQGAAEYLLLAGVCRAKKLHAAAVRCYATAFDADANLADNLAAGHRYHAACSAAQAAAGRGEDADKLDDKVRTRLRQQALDWLRADLALRTTQLESGKPADRGAVQQALKHWQEASDLASLHDAVALANLPAEERTACEQLWADVAALLKKAEPAPKKEGK
jgi:tetratricopeptide (TPR) repeat protein